MPVLTSQVVSIAGTAPSYAAASAGGDTVAAGEDVFVLVRNASGSSVTLTVTTPGTHHSLDVDDLAVAIPAGEERLVGPLTADLFGDQVQLAYSATTQVTVAAVQVGRLRAGYQVGAMFPAADLFPSSVLFPRGS
jgi:hypothetical protein